MNAPGNLILIVTLFAVFVACCGYAAGRVHQRRQTGHDAAEAYRDGYETATRRVFSLAARVIGPRRSGVRASAAVAVVPPPAPPVLPDQLGPAVDAAPTVGGGVEMSELAFPVPQPPPSGTVPEPPAVGGVSRQPFPDPRGGGDTTVLPDIRDLIEGAEAGADQRVPRPSRPISPAPLVTDQPGKGASRPAGHRASADDDDDEGGAEVSDAVSSSGRHTVPDELVRASTYRLPPDRIFRAKVRDAGTPPDDPATRLVPKPRQS